MAKDKPGKGHNSGDGNVSAAQLRSFIEQMCEHVRRSMALAEKWNTSTKLVDILVRFTASSTPSDGMPLPPLWLDFEAQVPKLLSAPWPPTTSGA